MQSIRDIPTLIQPTPEELEAALRRPAQNLRTLEGLVRQVFDAVGQDGDAAVRAYTQKFDGATLPRAQIAPGTIRAAKAQLSTDLKAAVQVAAGNIRRFHEAQRQEVRKIETMPGVTCWRRQVPIEKVGLYVPGGSAPLLSTVLMLGIPAQLAGCAQVVLSTPPDASGAVDPAILYAADVVGIREVFRIGGIQAIAAMSLGTESVPRVDKLFGPGNAFVTAAKEYATQLGTAIDMPAGPSEVLVVADDTADPRFVAADLLSQAEHGADSQAVLVSLSSALTQAVRQALEAQLADLPRREVALQALRSSALIEVSTRADARAIVNSYAPEHLILAVRDYAEFAEGVTQAGSVFLGNYTPESAGDYASGTNHTLPTNGAARAFSGVSLDSFVRQITFQEITPDGLKALQPTIAALADAEQLQAHRRAVDIRFEA